MVGKKELKKITYSLRNALKEITKLKLVDSMLRARYAEYLIAYELVKRGYDVQLSSAFKGVIFPRKSGQFEEFVI